MYVCMYVRTYVHGLLSQLKNLHWMWLYQKTSSPRHCHVSSADVKSWRPHHTGYTLNRVVTNARYVLKEAQRILYIEGDRRRYCYTNVDRKRSMNGPATWQLDGGDDNAWTSTILCMGCGNFFTANTDGLTFLNLTLWTNIFKTRRRPAANCIFQLATTHSQPSHAISLEVNNA
jgi:hypothetical protein